MCSKDSSHEGAACYINMELDSIGMLPLWTRSLDARIVDQCHVRRLVETADRAQIYGGAGDRSDNSDTERRMISHAD